MSELQTAYTTKDGSAKILSVHNIVVGVNTAGYEPSKLLNNYDWMNALHYGHITILAAHEQPPASALLAYKVVGKPRDRVDELELSLERHDADLTKLRSAIDHLRQRLEAVDARTENILRPRSWDTPTEHARGDYE